MPSTTNPRAGSSFVLMCERKFELRCMAITPTCGLGYFAASGQYSAPFAAPENCTYAGAGAAANAGAPKASAPAMTSAFVALIMGGRGAGRGSRPRGRGQLLALLGRHLALLLRGPAAAIAVDAAHVLAHALALLAAHVLRLELAFVPLSGLRGRRSRGERKDQRKEEAFHGCGNVTRVRFRRRVAVAEICNNVLPDARAQDADPRRPRRPAPARPAGALPRRRGLRGQGRSRRPRHGQAARPGALRPGGARPDAARRGWPRHLPAAARPERRAGDHHADREGRRRRSHRRPRDRRRRLPTTAVQFACG